MHLNNLQVGSRSLRKRNTDTTSTMVSDDGVKAVLSHWASSSSIPLRHHQRKFRNANMWSGGEEDSCNPWPTPFNKIHALPPSILISWDIEGGWKEATPSKATHLERHQKTFCWGRFSNWVPPKVSWSPRTTSHTVTHTAASKVELEEGGFRHLHRLSKKHPHPP